MNKGTEHDQMMKQKKLLRNSISIPKVRSQSESDVVYDNNDNVKSITDSMQKSLYINTNEGNSPRSVLNTPLSPSIKSSVLSTTSHTTKLHELCNSANPSIEMIRIYISTYPWALKQQDMHGDIPLHVALKRDDQASLLICELLNKYPEGARVKDCDGNLPLFLACRQQKVTTNILKALLQAYPGGASSKSFGSLALHHLCQNGNSSPESIRLLITANPQAVTTPNSYGNLPLHFICASDKAQVEATRILMHAFPAGITHLNKMNETPIARALKKNGSDEMRERVRLLLRLADKANLNEEQLQLLKDLNWGARKAVILLCAQFARNSDNDHDPNDRGLLHYYKACDGVFRHIIHYL